MSSRRTQQPNIIFRGDRPFFDMLVVSFKHIYPCRMQNTYVRDIFGWLWRSLRVSTLHQSEAEDSNRHVLPGTSTKTGFGDDRNMKSGQGSCVWAFGASAVVKELMGRSAEEIADP